MLPIKKQIISDENSQPVAVIIDYQDWQKIEALLQKLPEPDLSTTVNSFAGAIHLTLDPLDYQRQIRDEWN